MKVKKEKPNNKNDKGFTLIEVLLAIVILSLVSAPILRGFIVTANTSARARKIMEATDVAQLIVEDISSMSFDDDGGFNKTFLDSPTNTRDRLKAIPYEAAGSVIPLAQGEFFNKVRNESGSSKTVYICTHEAPDTNEKYKGYKVIALPNVDYDNVKYDVLIWYKGNNSEGSRYYTYDIAVQVFGQDETGGHYAHDFVTLKTNISNKY